MSLKFNNCEIVRVETSSRADFSSVNDTSLEILSNPYGNAAKGTYHIRPLDLIAEKTYRFFVRVTLLGGASLVTS